MRHLTPLLLLLIAPMVMADPPKPAALVEKLGDADFRTREAAGKKLLELGEKSLPVLEAGQMSDSAEVARRCEDLLAAVKHKLDVDAVLVPTMVDLPDGKQVVRQVLDSLKRQSGYSFRVDDVQTVLAETVTLTGGVMTFWEAVQALNTGAKLDVVKVDAQPPNGIVWLRTADGTTRTTAHQAVLVQVFAPPANEIARHPTTVSPLSVRAFPEPKVKWQRLTAAEVVKAVDKSERPVGPALVTPSPQSYPMLRDEIIEEKRVERLSPGNSAFQGNLFLASGSSEVASLSGQVRFTAWKEPGELVAMKLSEKGKTGTADGSCGTRLSATLVRPISNEPGSTQVELKVRWDADRVRVEQTAGAGDAVWFENVGGRMVPVKTNATLTHAQGMPTTMHGVRITNAAGEPLTLSSGGVRIDSVREHGRVYSEVSVNYTVKAGKLADGVPAAVSFHAARLVEGTVPFTAADLPLSPGTRDPEERVRYKK